MPVVRSLIWSEVKKSYGQQWNSRKKTRTKLSNPVWKINKRIPSSHQLLVIYNLAPSELTYKKYL